MGAASPRPFTANRARCVRGGRPRKEQGDAWQDDAGRAVAGGAGAGTVGSAGGGTEHDGDNLGTSGGRAGAVAARRDGDGDVAEPAGRPRRRSPPKTATTSYPAAVGRLHGELRVHRLSARAAHRDAWRRRRCCRSRSRSARRRCPRPCRSSAARPTCSPRRPRSATNFSQQLMSTLPTNRDIPRGGADGALGPPDGTELARSPSPARCRSRTCSWSTASSVNENLRGQPQSDLVIEDAVQETTVATAGISAEFGRFGGGVVNVVTKSGGNLFTGSFRDTLTNDDWRALVPRRDGDPYAGDSKLDDVVPTYEYTVGGPIVRDRLWFFHAGRLQTQTANRQLISHQHSLHLHRQVEALRRQADLRPRHGHRVQGVVRQGAARRPEQHLQHDAVDGPDQPRAIAASRKTCSPSTTPASSPPACSSKDAIRSAT